MVTYNLLVSSAINLEYVNPPTADDSMAEYFNPLNIVSNVTMALLSIKLQSSELFELSKMPFDELFNDALEIVQTEYENTIFPKTWQFTYEIDLLLTTNFWKKS